MSGDPYKSAGVDAAACDRWLKQVRESVPAIGGFGGVLRLTPSLEGLSAPCLVSAADGVGTKVLVARAAGNLGTVGIDCVAMVVNDLVCRGARPLFFLDYLAMEHFDAGEAWQLLAGIRKGCAEAGCALLGGETAELPGLLTRTAFDVAGFGVGIVDESRLIDGSRISGGDVVIGLASSGLHSNGFSLVRRLFPEYASDRGLAEGLLIPTRIYSRAILSLLDSVPVHGIAHITGGGLLRNLTRVVPAGLRARLDPAAWSIPRIFESVAERGGLEYGAMARIFNMGIGMCVIVPSKCAAEALALLAEHGRCSQIGEVLNGEAGVEITGWT
ncbi:phosphoribosylformylglycinamidine cyclo-ligase [Candidatus Poribacteria bacterium]|nr:phosphoribosylformylglycinamidine cyclo-ligase [Candidatus Poribacteria bacterium]